ncbi:Bug family tripartite tricarboxylate transporter substrate binding protein [Bordetella hinzii]|uniref:Tripartite tricarboxylate transporter substrate binding protein n=3 Tax=Bordetella hinzii TaxID=103855 RepID=A0AAN1RYW7_9BORD|nr:tripartite tricarboxylate transporter substrate binding protein [Bordetella hinzii]AKQ55834.1 Tripartite tricarboxylate transporter family receptor [Bordetella hinzii]AKQ60366.1 Tripartite tricarboxylate transporter family receptor [Bordetella hinzii]AZW18574.1 tripartite tricarboxylate transporter substrate binding protein [Bordetella hinzii]KCB25179.1 tripartite tricarboxylate transporter family receptor [Bordetella hinzii L60]KCB25537.1 tripartite tricarboxylate transporter family recept
MKRLLIAVCMATLSWPAMADTYPSRPVRVIVPYQAGQGTDVATRFLAEHLARALGQSFVIENRPGAGGNIGASEVARAAPDGYTLVMGTNATHVLNQFLYSNLNFNPEKDFDPVMLVSSFPMVFLAPAGSPYRNLQDLLKASRAKPDSVDVGLPSTTARLVLELLEKQSTTRISGIPYKGSATAMTDLLGGRVALGIDTISAARSFIDSGKLKPLAVTSLKPSELLPGVPAAASEGVTGFQVIAWNALFAPHGTPPAVIKTLNEQLARILERPEVRKRLLELGHEPAGGSPGELAAFAQSERKKWGPLIEEAGLKAD